MTYDVSGDRVPLELDGPAVEVQPIVAWAVFSHVMSLSIVFIGTNGDKGAVPALRDLCDFFVREGQPTWNIRDHHGPIPTTAAGMLRLPLPLALAMVDKWAETFTPPPTAADEVLPEGPVRDAVNAGLKAARRKKV